MNTQNNNHIGSIETETEASPKCATRPNGLPSPQGRETDGEGEQRVQKIQDSAPGSARLNRKSSIVNPNPTPRGKVAHLPKIVREQVNQMLDDGVTSRKIAKKLAELG